MSIEQKNIKQLTIQDTGELLVEVDLKCGHGFEHTFQDNYILNNSTTKIVRVLNDIYGEECYCENRT